MRFEDKIVRFNEFHPPLIKAVLEGVFNWKDPEDRDVDFHLFGHSVHSTLIFDPGRAKLSRVCFSRGGSAGNSLYLLVGFYLFVNKNETVKMCKVFFCKN